MARVGIFGGSFNPPHLGHLHAAQQLLQELRLDWVEWIPDNLPPHKQLADGSPDGATRLELVRRLIAGQPGMRASDLELRRGGASYTYQTLQQRTQQAPEDELYFLMGTDMFLSFLDWREPQEILRLATLVLALRQTPDAAEQQAIEAQRARLTAMGARIVVLQARVVEMSSTLVRRMLAFSCAQDYLAPPVLELIRARGLYGTAIVRKNLPFDELRRQSLALHKPGRRPHAEGCSRTAKQLAQRWGADPDLAERAGILHDVTKALDGPAHLRLCARYGMPLTQFERDNDKLLHAKSGAAVARDVFGECETVWRAILWHTTGKGNMTKMEKILYLADYIEPNRDFEGVELLRTLAQQDLDLAMLRAFEMSVELLEAKGRPVDPYSLQARDMLRAQLEAERGVCYGK